LWASAFFVRGPGRATKKHRQSEGSICEQDDGHLGATVMSERIVLETGSQMASLRIAVAVARLSALGGKERDALAVAVSTRLSASKN